MTLFAALAWWGIESILYYRKLRLRVALELAEPLVADSFRMNGLCSITLAMIVAITAGSPILRGHPGRDDAILGPLMLVLWAIVCASGSCAWLSPRVYRDYVERRYGERRAA